MAWSKRTFRRGEMASYTFFKKTPSYRPRKRLISGFSTPFFFYFLGPFFLKNCFFFLPAGPKFSFFLSRNSVAKSGPLFLELLYEGPILAADFWDRGGAFFFGASFFFLWLLPFFFSAERCLRRAASVSVSDIACDGRFRARSRTPLKHLCSKQRCGI